MTLSELLTQAAAASTLGDREEAERLFRRATERSPANTRAWLGLAGATQDPAEKQACFERVLALDPANGEARVALQRLAARAGGEQAAAIQAVLNESAARNAALPPQPTAAVPVRSDDGHEHVAQEGVEALLCVNHPDTETTLRCNRCGRPVCYRCVELTEVGYRCKDCIREQQNVYFDAVSIDYVVAALVSFVLAAIAAPVIGLLFGLFGWFGLIIAFFVGPAVGGIAATIIRRAVGRRRGRYLGLVAVVAIIMGTGASVLVGLQFGLLPNLLALAVFLFLALSTIYATLR